MTNTVSLTTAKALKEAGFKQDTEYFWWHSIDIETYSDDRNGNYVAQGVNIFSDSKICAAPSTDELLEQLPKGTWVLYSTFGGYALHYKEEKIWTMDLVDERAGLNISELFAQFWLYLKQQNLIK